MKDRHWGGRDLAMMSHRRKTNKHLRDLLKKNNLLKENPNVVEIAKSLSVATLEVLGLIFIGVILFAGIMGGLVIVLANIYGP